MDKIFVQFYVISIYLKATGEYCNEWKTYIKKSSSAKQFSFTFYVSITNFVRIGQLSEKLKMFDIFLPISMAPKCVRSRFSRGAIFFSENLYQNDAFIRDVNVLLAFDINPPTITGSLWGFISNAGENNPFNSELLWNVVMWIV